MLANFYYRAVHLHSEQVSSCLTAHQHKKAI